MICTWTLLAPASVALVSGAVTAIVAVLIGAPVMNAPTLTIQLTEPRAEMPPVRVQVIVPELSVQSDADGPPKLEKVTSGGSTSVTVNVPEAIAAVFLTLIVYANASPTWTAVVGGGLGDLEAGADEEDRVVHRPRLVDVVAGDVGERPGIGVGPDGAVGRPGEVEARERRDAVDTQALAGRGVVEGVERHRVAR